MNVILLTITKLSIFIHKMLLGLNLDLYTCNCLREQFIIFLKLPANVVKSSYILRQFTTLLTLSAYEVKNNCCLFERLFKVKKIGVLVFGISFLFLEIFTFLCHANEDSDDIIH